MIQIKTFQTADKVGQAAAQKVAQMIRNFKPTADKSYLVLGLPTGSTPLPMYRALVDMHRTGNLSFKNVVTFNMDEYCDLAPEHAQSYHTFMYENLFNHIDIDPKNIHILNGCAEDKNAECCSYEEAIALAGGIDLQIGGIGSNGHIAFNEPNTPFDSKTHIVHLAEQTCKDNARFFDGDITQVPHAALSIGLGTIMKAKEVLILATGAGKAQAVALAVSGPCSEQLPASILQNHAHASFYLDKGASEK